MNAFAAYSLLREYVHDFLGDFAIEILGVCVGQGEVGFAYPKSQGEALLKALYDKRDKFVYEGGTLSVKDVDQMAAARFVVPRPDTDHPGSSYYGGTQRFTYGSPIATRRSATVHSGVTPDLAQKHLTLTEFLTSAEHLPAVPVAPPLPGSDTGPVLQAILAGVNELREKAVTHEALQKYHKMQSEELVTFVKAETEPLHQSVARLGRDVEHIARDAAETHDRLVVLENRPNTASSSSSVPLRASPHDPGFKRISFRGMDEKADPYDRIDAIEQFIKKHFPRVQIQATENYYKSDFKGKKHELTKVSFVEFASPVVREQVIETIEANKKGTHKFRFGGKEISIVRGLSEGANARNGVLKAAERALQKDARCQSMTVKIVWENRTVTVGGVCAYKQGGQDLGQFVAPFADMSLPERRR